LKLAIRTGRRTQDSLVPNKFYYLKAFRNLPKGNNHIVAVVQFTFSAEEDRIVPNNFVVTAYQTFLHPKRGGKLS
jgi:hypothetical protein